MRTFVIFAMFICLIPACGFKGLLVLPDHTSDASAEQKTEQSKNK